MAMDITEAEFDQAILKAQTVRVEHAGVEGMAVDGKLLGIAGSVKYARVAKADGMSAILAEFDLAGDLNVTLTAGNDILVTFILDGGIGGERRDGRRGLDFRIHCAMMRLPTGAPDVTIRVPGKCHNAFVQLRIAPPYFRQWLEDLHLKLPVGWAGQLSNNDGRVLHNSAWTVPIDSCLRQIIHTRLPRRLFLPYFGAKAIELLTLFTHELTVDAECPADFVLDRVALAQEILMSDLANAPTISELARRLNWNETDLKVGFRRRFGSSIGAYVIDARLRMAADLLEGTDLSVFSVASTCGWRCQARFGCAFKARFGVTPTAYRAQVAARSA